jgi:hypothetical protein
MWWIFGAIVLVLGILFLWIDPDEEATPSYESKVKAQSTAQSLSAS